jgi:hypothetical protein
VLEETDGALPRDIVFVIDVSGSMSIADRLVNAKEAFTELVQQLDSADMFAVHAFSTEATRDPPFGPVLATAANKALAAEYVDRLVYQGMTHLHGAYMAGLCMLGNMERPSSDGDGDDRTPPVKLLLVLSDGEATARCSAFSSSQATSQCSGCQHTCLLGVCQHTCAFLIDAPLCLSVSLSVSLFPSLSRAVSLSLSLSQASTLLPLVSGVHSLTVSLRRPLSYRQSSVT